MSDDECLGMNIDRPAVSVVVPTRNRVELLPKVLGALERQTFHSFEVIVVDDASEDETAAVLAEWQGPNRRAFRLPRPWGSYAARNRGVDEALAMLVAFTDDDCLPEPGWLAALVEAMGQPDVVGAQGVTLAQPGPVTPFTHQID